MSVANLGYAVLQMKDPDAWAEFAQDVLGFGKAKSYGKDGAAYLRMDEAPFRYMVVKGDNDRYLASGYDAGSKAAFDAQIKAFEAADIAICHGTDEDAAHRAVSSVVFCKDPSGNNVEVYYGRDEGEAFAPGHGIEEFKTGDMGLGHVVLPAPENQATIDFYQDIMGFGLSDDLTLPAFAPDFPDQRIYFMHANNPRHHTLALYNFPNPSGVIHLMAEVGDMDELGHSMDRVKAAGLHILATLGRHSNDEMISFYFMAPGGIAFEVGYDGKTIEDWSQFTPTKSTTGDIWGHEYNFPEPETEPDMAVKS